MESKRNSCSFWVSHNFWYGQVYQFIVELPWVFLVSLLWTECWWNRECFLRFLSQFLSCFLWFLNIFVSSFSIDSWVDSWVDWWIRVSSCYSWLNVPWLWAPHSLAVQVIRQRIISVLPLVCQSLVMNEPVWHFIYHFHHSSVQINFAQFFSGSLIPCRVWKLKKATRSNHLYNVYYLFLIYFRIFFAITNSLETCR